MTGIEAVARHVPVLLEEVLDGLNIRQRGELKKAVGMVNRGSDALHNAGDSFDEARVKRGSV